jgi:hypothetical protein
VVFDFHIATEGFGSRFEFTFADVAPGALNVGPDVYFDGVSHHYPNRASPPLFPEI